jgi:hypothetical protein
MWAARNRRRMMATFTVEVRQIVTVDLDENKFDEAFMQEFRESFYNFDKLSEHAEHIAQMEARGLIDATFGDGFIEGYGPASEMGIKARVGDIETEVLRT